MKSVHAHTNYTITIEDFSVSFIFRTNYLELGERTELSRKTVSGIMLALLLTLMLMLAFNIQPVRGSGTIYIRADGSVDPPTAPIQRDGDVYTFNDNIYDSIAVERSNIVVDGAGYTVQGIENGTGIILSHISNVTIKYVRVANYDIGIGVYGSGNNNLIYNEVTNNSEGIVLGQSWYNILSSNNVSANHERGIYLDSSYSNNLVNNIVTNNYYGVDLSQSSDNYIVNNNCSSNWVIGINLFGINNTLRNNNISFTLAGCGIILNAGCNNTIIDNNVNSNCEGGIILTTDSCYNNITTNNINLNYPSSGIYLDEYSNNNTITQNNVFNNTYGIYFHHSFNNSIFHNNFVNNTQQIYNYEKASANVWDDGYPSGGNYWSDYTGVDEKSGPNQDEPGSDGIGDTAYVIDENNVDNYPFMTALPTGDRYVGVKVGDWAKLDLNLQGSPPENLFVGFAEYEWCKFEVQSISGTNITLAHTIHCYNGTEFSVTSYNDVKYDGGFWWIIAKDLNPGDRIYDKPHEILGDLFLNGTISRVYVGVSREINYVNFTVPDYILLGIPYTEHEENFTYRFYWDRATGVLCEFSISGSSWSFSGIMSETNVFTPEWRKDIQPGDMLLHRTEGPLACIFEWTHAGIYVGNGQVVEARWEGVDYYPISDWDFPNDVYVTSLRVKTASQEQIEEAVEFAKGQADAHKFYGAWIGKDSDPDKASWYCSELVWAAYHNQGIDIEKIGEYGEPYQPTDPVTPDEIYLDDDIEVVSWHMEKRPECKVGLIVKAKSPVDLIITDPDGLKVSKDSNEIPGSAYIVIDTDGDGSREDFIVIPERKIGDYLITVMPKPDAGPTDTYTLEASAVNATITLAEKVPISDIPSQPYLLESMETGISQSVTFNAVWESVNYPVVVSSNSTVAQLNFNQSLAQISFEVSGETGIIGYCNVTIPKDLLKGPWTVEVDGVTWSFTPSNNATHSFIYFTYTHASTLQVTIRGTWVIPEFPTPIITLLFIAFTMLAVAFTKKKLPRKLKT